MLSLIHVHRSKGLSLSLEIVSDTVRARVMDKVRVRVRDRVKDWVSDWIMVSIWDWVGDMG